MSDPVRTFAWPLRKTPSGRLATVAVDSEVELAQAVDMVCTIPDGSVRAIPSLGRPELALRHLSDERQEDTLRAAVADQEPRVNADALEFRAAGGVVTVDTRSVRSVSDSTTSGTDV